MSRLKPKIDTKLSFSEFLIVLVIDIPVVLYQTLLFKITWSWFFVDKFFEVGYWELFLGLAAFRFFIGGAGVNMTQMRLENEIGKPSFEEWITYTFSRTLNNTMFFGIFFIIHLIISYYS